MNPKKDKYGLITTDWQEMKRVFSKFQTLEKVVMFGSRVKKTFKPGSDVDLAIVEIHDQKTSLPP